VLDVSEHLTPEQDTIGGQTDPDDAIEDGDEPVPDEEEA
jgi:hypothetical protein